MRDSVSLVGSAKVIEGNYWNGGCQFGILDAGSQNGYRVVFDAGAISLYSYADGQSVLVWSK